MGAVIGSMDVAMNANMIEVERGLRRAILSASHGFWSLGAFVGGVLGSFVIAKAGYVAQALAVAGLVALVLALVARHLHAEPVVVVADVAPTRHALLPRDAALWILGLMTMAAMVPEGAVLDWAAIYLSKEHGSSLTVAGLGFALFAGTMAVMRFAGDAIRNRFGAVKTLRGSGLVAAAGLMLAAVAPVDLLAIAGFALDVASFGDALTAAGRVVGTERYASPEQLAGRKLDGATDVYSLGLVLFESVAGQPPFSGSGSVLRAQIRNESPPSLRSLLPEVPPVLDDLVRRMLAKSPTDRPIRWRCRRR